MDSLPPDPYAALGVAKDATTAAIKQQYRKLVLKLHPDKVQDEALKQAAVDQFHKVQTAYEIVSDDDRRQRYDAQCKLEQLRREAMERGGGGRGGPDVRTAGFRMPPESARGGDFFARGPERSYSGRMSPQFEERAPKYDYFDSPRPTSRKDTEFDRSSKRAPPREDSKKSKTAAKKSKENERSNRDERSRRTDQDMRRERERKSAFVFEQSPTSDSDEYERARRQRREEDDLQKARATMEEEMRRRKDEAATASVLGDERANKYFSQDFNARAYMASSGNPPLERTTSDRRPSPVRKSSSRENVEYIKRKDGKPPVMIRRGSGRPETTREPRKSSSRENDIEIVAEPEEMPRRPPTLNKTNSSPTDIRPPFERQRSSSLQFDPRDPPIPQMKRAETMPYHSNGTSGESRRKDPSKLRTEIPYPTPESSPEPPKTRKHSYGRAYADDTEYATPDGYRTEFREPVSPRNKSFERTAPPVEEPREKQRSSSSKYAPPQPPPNKRTTSTTKYSYPSPIEVTEPTPRRPSLQRESSSRLFGEIPSTRSPRPTQSKYSPPLEDISWSPKPRVEDIKTTSLPRYEDIRTGRSRRQPERAHSSRKGTPVY